MLAFDAMNQPAWLARVLNKLKKPRIPAYQLQQYILFREAERPTFLALVWSARSHIERVFDLHKVKVNSPHDIRLTFVREYRDFALEIVEPTGHDSHGGGKASVFLRYGSGGSGYFGYGLRIIRLVRSSVDVSPIWLSRSVRTLPLNKKGAHALIVSDDRWAGYFNGCGACGPRIPIMTLWDGNRYQPACRQFHAFFEERLNLIDQIRRKEEQEQKFLTFFLRRRAAMALNLAQIGRAEKAKSTYSAMLTSAATLPDFRRTPADEMESARWIERLNADVGPAIEVADRHSHFACPLLAFSGAATPHGAIERIKPFRYAD
jgi:hypothetical protein